MRHWPPCCRTARNADKMSSLAHRLPCPRFLRSSSPWRAGRRRGALGAIAKSRFITGGTMAISLANLGNAVKDFLNTQVMGSLFELRAGETEVPSSAYAHNGDTPGNSWVVLDDESNFQLFRGRVSRLDLHLLEPQQRLVLRRPRHEDL